MDAHLRADGLEFGDGAGVVGVTVGDDDPAHVGERAAQLGEAALDAGERAGDPGIDERDLALGDCVHVDADRRGHADEVDRVDAGCDLHARSRAPAARARSA